MTVKITGVWLEHHQDVVNKLRRMQQVNFRFKYYSHALIESHQFDLLVESISLTVHADNYKIILSDIIPNDTIIIHRDECDSIIIE